MTMKIILVSDSGKQAEKLIDDEIHDETLEEDCYRIGCKVAKAIAERHRRKHESML